MSKAPEQSEDRLIMPGKAARLLGVDRSTVRRWQMAGLLAARRTVGGQRRYHESEVLTLAAQLDEVTS